MWLQQAGGCVFACSVTSNSLICILHVELMFYMIWGRLVFFFFFSGGGLTILYGLWDLGSLTMDQTHDCYTGSVES